MKKILISLITIFSFSTVAGIHQAPPAFNTNDGKVIFVDFINAVYELTYDHKSRKSWASTSITFMANDTGFPIFDSVATPTEVIVNGRSSEHTLTPVPGNVSFVRYPKTQVTPGIHTMVIRTPIEKGVKYGWKGVASGFFIKDLKDRMFLERFLPTNYEYDQYQMTYRVQIIGTNKSHNIFANGVTKEISNNFIEVSYPSFYTSSSVYFHLVPKRRFWRLNFNFASISGRQVPVTIYSNYRFRNWRMKRRTLKVMRELEKDYGPWPHPKLLVYGTKIKGGMEYVGATATSYISLGHELQHSYFAKGVLPADGNSGWMDEGIASWRDKGHQTHTKPDYFSANLGKHNVYTRKTDKRSYVMGRTFFAYINHQLKQAGHPGLKDFLRGYFDKRKFTTVTTNDFKSDLEAYSGLNFTDDFNQYIYGGHPDMNKGRAPAVEPENPHHVEYTQEEIDSII
jgi:hypothetical protein